MTAHSSTSKLATLAPVVKVLKVENSRLYALNYTFQSSRTMLRTSIEYNTQEELESELSASIVTLTPRWQDYLRHPRQALNSWIYGFELNIEMKGEEPAFLRKSLLHIAKRHSNISVVNIQNKTDEDPLIQALKNRINTRNNEIVRRQNLIRNNLLLYFLYGCIVTIGITPFSIAFAVLVEMLFNRKSSLTASSGLSKILDSISISPIILVSNTLNAMFDGMLKHFVRQWYLDSSAQYYSKKHQINAITNHRELTALDWGACSVGTGKYLLSYFSPSAWRHPRAFAAGLELALEGKQKRLDLIRERYTALRP